MYAEWRGPERAEYVLCQQKPLSAVQLFGLGLGLGGDKDKASPLGEGWECGSRVARRLNGEMTDDMKSLVGKVVISIPI